VTSYPKLGVLILNYNGERWLPPLYRSIAAQGYPDVHVYLVDNASDDQSIRITERNHPEVTILSMPRNLGYCAAYNAASPRAMADGCEWLAWVNSDVLLEKDCLLNLVHAGEADPGIGIAGPAFLEWEGDGPNAYMRGNHPRAIAAMQARSGAPIDVAWVEGSVLMVKRHCFRTVGPLDPFLYMFWEEADFCRRARRCNFRVVLVPNAWARHYGGGAWTGATLQARRRWLLTRNQYIYEWANPDQPFWENTRDFLRLFGVRAKQEMHSASALLAEFVMFGKVLREFGDVRRKWLRDRAMIIP
jgi:GT2 family glycosyltransferase